MGQEKTLPGLMLGIKAEIWFKCLLIVFFCLLTFPRLHCVPPLQEKIVTEIKLSGKVLRHFQCQSHRACGNAIPEGKQSRSVRVLSFWAGKTPWKKMSSSPSANHVKRNITVVYFSSLFDLTSLREYWFYSCAIPNATERWDWTSLFVQLVAWPERHTSEKEIETQ